MDIIDIGLAEYVPPLVWHPSQLEDLALTGVNLESFSAPILTVSKEESTGILVNTRIAQLPESLRWFIWCVVVYNHICVSCVAGGLWTAQHCIEFGRVRLFIKLRLLGLRDIRFPKNFLIDNHAGTGTRNTQEVPPLWP